MSSEETLKSLHIFTEEHVQTSDQCKYLEGFLYLISLLKNLIRAENLSENFEGCPSTIPNF